MRNENGCLAAGKASFHVITYASVPDEIDKQACHYDEHPRKVNSKADMHPGSLVGNVMRLLLRPSSKANTFQTTVGNKHIA
jgi:hypothetical protein